jgi:hypothetical protein
MVMLAGVTEIPVGGGPTREGASPPAQEDRPATQAKIATIGKAEIRFVAMTASFALNPRWRCASAATLAGLVAGFNARRIRRG